MTAVALIGLEGTARLAAGVAACSPVGAAVILRGPIGAGKTTFTGCLARALGTEEPVRSPTFTVAHEYALSDGRRLAHLDLYRQTGALDESAWGDLEPYFDAEFIVVEWPEPLVPWLAGRDVPTWHITLEPLTHPERRLAWIRTPPGLAPALTGSLAAHP